MKKILLSLLVVMMVCTMTNAQSRRGVPLSDKDAAIQKMMLKKAQSNGSKDGSDIAVFPYSLDFEDGSLGGWHTVDADDDGFSWSGSYGFGEGVYHNGSDGAATSASYDNDSYSALTPDNWLISPRIVVPSSSNLEISWYAAALDADYAADHYSVYVATDSNITSFTSAVYTETLSSSTFVKHSVNLASYAGQTIYVAFRHHNCTDEFVMAIDDISISQAGFPELMVTVPSTAFVGDTVALSASLSSGDTQNLTFAWMIQGAAPATASEADVVAVWSAAGVYSVACVATNNLGSDTVVAQIAVLDCSTITNFPYTEGFENGLGCWLSLDEDADGEGWMTLSDAGHTGESAAVSYSYTDGTALTPDNWLVSPAMEIPQEGTYELSWYVAPYAPSYPAEHYAVYVSTTGTALADFTDSLFVETLEDYEDYQYRVASLANYAGQTIHIAFRHFACEDEFALLIDDVRVASAGAPVASIVAPAVARASDEVVFSANVLSSSEVSYVWTFDGGDPATATTATAQVSFAEAGIHQVTLVVTNGFGADTAVAAINIIDCSGTIAAPFTEGFESGMGCWTSLDLDGDGYGWESFAERMAALGMAEDVSSYVHGGNDAMVSWSYYPTSLSFLGVEGISLSANDVMVSPAIELAAGQEWKLSFFASSFGGEEYPDDIEVRVAMTNPSSVTDFTTVLLSKESVLQSDFKQYILDLTQFAGQTIYLGFFHESSDMMGLLIDDVEVNNTVVAIENAETSVLTLFPNPTEGDLHVSAEGLLFVEVLDLNGRVVLRSEAADLNLSSLANGIYVVRSFTDKGVRVNKIVKK